MYVDIGIDRRGMGYMVLSRMRRMGYLVLSRCYRLACHMCCCHMCYCHMCYCHMCYCLSLDMCYCLSLYLSCSLSRSLALAHARALFLSLSPFSLPRALSLALTRARALLVVGKDVVQRKAGGTRHCKRHVVNRQHVNRLVQGKGCRDIEHNS